MANTIIMSKYQGLGNDYLILDPKKNQVQLQGKKIALLCQRGFGLGADGVLYGPVEIDGKLGVRIFNADGSESAISGNGVRIFAKYLMDNGYITEKKFDIETMSGTIHVECLNSRATEFKVNIGKPSFISSDIPVSGEVREVIKENFVFHGKEYKATCLPELLIQHLFHRHHGSVFCRLPVRLLLYIFFCVGSRQGCSGLHLPQISRLLHDRRRRRQDRHSEHIILCGNLHGRRRLYRSGYRFSLCLQTYDTPLSFTNDYFVIVIFLN